MAAFSFNFSFSYANCWATSRLFSSFSSCLRYSSAYRSACSSLSFFSFCSILFSSSWRRFVSSSFCFFRSSICCLKSYANCCFFDSWFCQSVSSTSINLFIGRLIVVHGFLYRCSEPVTFSSLLSRSREFMGLNSTYSGGPPGVIWVSGGNYDISADTGRWSS